MNNATRREHMSFGKHLIKKAINHNWHSSWHIAKSPTVIYNQLIHSCHDRDQLGNGSSKLQTFTHCLCLRNCTSLFTF